MNNEFQQFQKVFSLLLEADRKIWEAVIEIRNYDNKQLTQLVNPLMKLRGEMHIEFMRPIYKKYPKIAEKYGFDEKS